MVDKAGAREALFGHEPTMAEEPVRRRGPWGERDDDDDNDDDDDLIERVGPWGAVRSD